MPLHRHVHYFNCLRFALHVQKLYVTPVIFYVNCSVLIFSGWDYLFVSETCHVTLFSSSLNYFMGHLMKFIFGPCATILWQLAWTDPYVLKMIPLVC